MLLFGALPSLAIFGMDVSDSVLISFLFRRLLKELSNIYVLLQMGILVCNPLRTPQSKKKFCVRAGKKKWKENYNSNTEQYLL